MARASLVIATRNRATQLAEGLRSIRERAYSDLEIILVDDGSEDDTPEVLNSFADLFAKVIYLPRGAGGYSWNPGSVLNVGHRAATTDVHLEQGGEVCHLNDCVAPLLAECRPGQVALSRCYHGLPFDMRAVVEALSAGRLPIPETVYPERCETEAGHWLAPTVGPTRTHLYTGAERLAPFLFLGAIHVADFIAVGGYDETRRDRNDTDLANRLQARGVRFAFVGSALAFHLKHDKR